MHWYYLSLGDFRAATLGNLKSGARCCQSLRLGPDLNGI